MKYSVEIEISLPLDRVIELFDNFDNLKHWQKDLIDITHISGNPGEPGAKSKLRYTMGKREVAMIETIINREPPNLFVFTYETNNVWNQVNNYFSEAASNRV